MPRTIGGIDLGSVLSRSLGPALEQGLVLRSSGKEYTASGLWSREGEGARVVLVPNTGTLGTVRPLPGDVVEHQGSAMRVVEAEGMDEVVWDLQCSRALDVSPKPAAPELEVSYPMARRVSVRIASLSSEDSFRTAIRRPGTAWWTDDSTRKSLRRVFKVPPGGQWEVLGAVIGRDGSSSAVAVSSVSAAEQV